MADITTKYKSKWTGKEIDEGIEMAKNAVPLDGSKAMTDSLTITRSATPVFKMNDATGEGEVSVYLSKNATYIGNNNVAGSSAARRQIAISNSNGHELATALRFVDTVNSKATSYNILHTGNMPKVSYTGNGSATPRTIDTGGLESCCMLYCTQGIAFIGYWGGVGFEIETQTIYYIPQAEATFRNGVLNLATTNSIINGNSRTIYCKVI